MSAATAPRDEAAPNGICISADSHITEPPDTYLDRIDPKFRDRAPRRHFDETVGDVMVIDGGQAVVPYFPISAAGIPSNELSLDKRPRFEDVHPSGWDPSARVADQERDGVVAEVLYPSVGMLLCNHPDYDYKQACFDAYNLWIAEYCEKDPRRLIGLGQTALRSVEDGVRDLHRIKELGLRGVMLAGVPAVEDFDSEIYAPLWETAIELDLPLSFHILTMGGTGNLTDIQVRGPKMNGFLSIIRGCQDIMGTLILGGVFERHSDLRVVCVEADAGWAPHYMYRMDHAFKRHGNWLESGKLSKLPSEYFQEHIYLTFQDDWVAFKMIDMVNPDRLCWANDFPHSDSTWPHSQAMLSQHTRHLSAEQKDRILRGNIAELYGLGF
jgi:predicted TIM-barrel fold metal-dependent hydrolase